MLKNKLVTLGVLSVCAFAGIGASMAAEHANGINAQDMGNVGEERKRKIQEWQQSLSDWEMREQQRQSAEASRASNLAQQGVETLPDTGPGHPLVLFAAVSALGYGFNRKIKPALERNIK